MIWNSRRWPGMLVSSAANVNVHDNLLAWNDAGIAVWSNDRPDRPSSGTVGISVHSNTVVMRDPGATSLEWTQYGSGKLFDSGRERWLEQSILVSRAGGRSAEVCLAGQAFVARRIHWHARRPRRALSVNRRARRGTESRRSTRRAVTDRDLQARRTRLSPASKTTSSPMSSSVSRWLARTGLLSAATNDGITTAHTTSARAAVLK